MDKYICFNCGEEQMECICSCSCGNPDLPKVHLWAPDHGCPKDIVLFTKEEIEEQEKCEHEEEGIFDNVCSGCGKVFED